MVSSSKSERSDLSILGQSAQSILAGSVSWCTEVLIFALWVVSLGSMKANCRYLVQE
jgi:hypothetical protein